ncbi:unnamed protein product [Notodromas monacha]|uniref:Uncharacterized protein n=1 Tax=Notodromas monacha TaxID=399045 RepID=A0A7R9C2B2_9CRUS|nr:unnamed protein product [Notodromas monacha]CAG0925127.1 unnamed protein product [Notodromas monacha]
MVKLTMSSASTSTMTEMQTSVTSTSSCPQFESAVVHHQSENRLHAKRERLLDAQLDRDVDLHERFTSNASRNMREVDKRSSRFSEELRSQRSIQNALDGFVDSYQRSGSMRAMESRLQSPVITEITDEESDDQLSKVYEAESVHRSRLKSELDNLFASDVQDHVPRISSTVVVNKCTALAVVVLLVALKFFSQSASVVPYGSSTSSNNGPPSFLSFSSGSTNYANSGNYKKDKALNEYQTQTSGHQHSEKGQDASNGFGGPPKDPRYNRPNKHHYESTIVDPFEAFQNIMGSSGPTLTWPAGVSENQESRTRMSQIVRTANNFIRQFPRDEDTVRNAARWAHGRQRMDLHPPDRVINSFATNFEIYIAIARMRNLQLLQRTTPELVEQLLDKLKKRMSSDALLRFGNPMETTSTFVLGRTPMNEAVRGGQLGFSSQDNFIYHYLKHGFDTAMEEGTMPWESFSGYLDGAVDGVGPFHYILEANEFIENFPVEQLRFFPEDSSLWSVNGVKIIAEGRDKKAVIVFTSRSKIWFATYFRRN